MPSKMSNRTVSLAAVAVLIGIAAPSAFAARTFCCSDDKSQQRCGDVLPEACRNRAYVEYNEAGLRVRSVARPLTEAEQAVKDAEDKKKREQAEAIAQQQRSDQALLSTYADEKDLDTAVERAVGELERSIKSAEAKLVDLKNGKAKLAGEKEFFKNKPLPPDLTQKIARSDANIASQQAAIDEKKKDLEDTKAKFEGFRKRLQELKAKSKEDSKT
jgi:predicted  nucleic acid-binding Zn-ribbon protein